MLLLTKPTFKWSWGFKSRVSSFGVISIASFVSFCFFLDSLVATMILVFLIGCVLAAILEFKLVSWSSVFGSKAKMIFYSIAHDMSKRKAGLFEGSHRVIR